MYSGFFIKYIPPGGCLGQKKVVLNEKKDIFFFFLVEPQAVNDGSGNLGAPFGMFLGRV